MKKKENQASRVMNKAGKKFSTISFRNGLSTDEGGQKPCWVKCIIDIIRVSDTSTVQVWKEKKEIKILSSRLESEAGTRDLAKTGANK